MSNCYQKKSKSISSGSVRREKVSITPTNFSSETVWQEGLNTNISKVKENTDTGYKNHHNLRRLKIIGTRRISKKKEKNSSGFL